MEVITQRMRDDAKIYPTANCDEMKFYHLVQVLETIKPNQTNDGKKKSKKTKVQHILTDQLEQRLDSHSPFPLIRLLVPNCDRERPTYGIKETALAKLFCSALHFDSKSKEAIALIKFNNPAKMYVSGLSCGDFPGVLEGVLTQGSRGSRGATMTIGEVNDCLDELARYGSQEEHVKVIEKIYLNMSPTEIKWFSRIVLKDLKIGLKHDALLKHIHPDGPDMFAKLCDMRLVLALLAVQKPTDSFICSLSLMHCFESMASKIARHSYDITNEFTLGFYIEWKFDGHRMQIHKRGDEVRCFSKSQNEGTHKYGKIIGPMIRTNIKCENCILDGEIIPWNSELKRFEKFSRVVSVAKHQISGKNTTQWLCFVIFDCVWCEKPQFDSPEMEHNFPTQRGNLVDLDLKTRKEYLFYLVNPIEHRLYVAEATFVEGSVEHRSNIIKNKMNDVINQGHEGIMVKSISSPYVCGSSQSKKLGHWIKLKPE